MMLYDSHVWRLQSTSPAFDIRLPKDLVWDDEFSWSPIKQSIDTTLTGALVVQEFRQDIGRPISLRGAQDSMGWVLRSTVDSLVQMRDTSALKMVLSYLPYDEDTDTFGTPLRRFDVMFRHAEAAIDVESVLGYDNFEPGFWYKVKSLRFMEVPAGTTSGCASEATISLANIVGGFLVGETVTGGTTNAVGVVTSYSPPTLKAIITSGSFQAGETITGSVSHATATVG